LLRTAGELLEEKVAKAASIKQEAMPHSRITAFITGHMLVGEFPAALFALY
jgi:hypothetical protein